MAAFAKEIDLSSLDGTTGFKLNGTDTGDNAGISVASAGDVNGDGFDDLIIGASRANAEYNNTGLSWVLFGKKSGFDAIIKLIQLGPPAGFQINGELLNDYSGTSVASAGDINGDGFDDLIIGASGVDDNGSGSGAAYVVFGKASGFPDEFELANLDGTDAFQINGKDATDFLGGSVSSAGDINGDGFDDLIIGANNAEDQPADVQPPGVAYVIFGHAGGHTENFSVGDLTPSIGFRLVGSGGYSAAGSTVSAAGDVNGDGIDDMIVGALGTSILGRTAAGASYVVFGRKAGLSGDIDLSTLSGTDGFQIAGADAGDYAGTSASAGDINADGFDDIIVSAPTADVAYVVFGKKSGFKSIVDLAGLNGKNGFSLSGEKTSDYAGSSVASAGDINGDGFDDVIIGARSAKIGGNATSGAAYVVFGKKGGFASNIDLASLDGTNGFRINGADAQDRLGKSVSSAGDINNDGFDDLIVGAYHAETDGNVKSGAAYVIFGRAPTEAVTRTGTDIGNTIRGGNFNDKLFGKGGDDNLFGSKGKDKLDGGKGKDNMDGGAGNDTYTVDSKKDKITDQSGKDTVRSKKLSLDLGKGKFDGVENATLTGKKSKDLTGDKGKNVLTGNKGKNTIDGEKGKDTLKGGKKADTFVFKTKYGKDKVTDFDAKGKDHDILDLRGLKSVKNYADLLDNHMVEVGRDVFIDGEKGDILTLKRVKLADLDAGDFLI